METDIHILKLIEKKTPKVLKEFINWENILEIILMLIINFFL